MGVRNEREQVVVENNHVGSPGILNENLSQDFRIVVDSRMVAITVVLEEVSLCVGTTEETWCSSGKDALEFTALVNSAAVAEAPEDFAYIAMRSEMWPTQKADELFHVATLGKQGGRSLVDAGWVKVGFGRGVAIWSIATTFGRVDIGIFGTESLIPGNQWASEP